MRVKVKTLMVTIPGLLWLLGGTVLGANLTLNLGRATNDMSPLDSFPLSGFHRIKQSPHRHRLPVFVFVGTLFDADLPSAKERWPVLKALEQFGAFRGVRPVERKCKPWPGVSRDLCGIPTFDWSHAAYRSSFLVFEHTDLLNAQAKYFQKFTPVEHSLFLRYAHHSGRTRADPENISSSVNSADARALPLIAVGGYLQSRSQLIATNDFEEQVQTRPGEFIGSGLSFADVHDALVNGINPAGTQLNADVNAETNIITAVICHADHDRPEKVCGRPVIKRIRMVGHLN
jgi:hypothetical protein